MGQVLVTGAAGFIGAALVAAMRERGNEVHALVHPRTDAWRLADLSSGVCIHRVDLTAPDALKPVVEGIEAGLVVHTAARAGHPVGPGPVMAAWHDTVVGTACLIESLRSVGTERFVHLGSSTEYEPGPDPLREDGPLRPSTARGAMKLAATVAVTQGAAELGIPLTVIRPFSVYGPKEMPGRLIPTIISCLRSGAAFSMTSETYRRDFVYLSDVVDACLAASTCPAAVGAVLNVGTGVESSTQEVVEKAQAVTGRRLRLNSEPFPARAADTAHWVADMSHTSSVLGWKPAVDLAEGLSRTFATYDSWSTS